MKKVEIRKALVRLADKRMARVVLIEGKAYLPEDRSKPVEGYTEIPEDGIGDALIELGKQEEEAANALVDVRADRQNEAFLRLIGTFTIKANYPAKQEAMNRAVASLPETATVDELFEAAKKLLGT